MTDFYEANAEWYAALIASWREGTDAVLRDMVGSLGGGDVVDIASGVGTALPVLRSLGAGRLFAVEPSRSMRAGLMTTIASDPELMRRTTVVAGGVLEALDELPQRWSAAVLLNAVGHLSDSDRRQLWVALGERLEPGARFVLSLQPPQQVTVVPWTDFGSVRIGERELRSRGRAEPVDDTHVLWTMEWSLLDATGALLETRTAEHAWRVLTADVLTEEAASVGLHAVHTEHDMVLAFEPATSDRAPCD